MFNKFIFSGLVVNLNEKKNSVSFTIPMPTGEGMIMEMIFDEKIVKNIGSLLEQGKVIVNVEGFIIPSNEKGLDLVTTNVSSVVMPEQVPNVA